MFLFTPVLVLVLPVVLIVCVLALVFVVAAALRNVKNHQLHPPRVVVVVIGVVIGVVNVIVVCRKGWFFLGCAKRRELNK